MTREEIIACQEGMQIIKGVETGYTPVNCTEMKATIDLYHTYFDKAMYATTKDEQDWNADICAVLLNRIKEMETRLRYELEQED